MNHEQLSKRLERVASYIPAGSVLADIGSDHAYLPCYSILNNQASKAIAGEVSDGPFNSARQQVRQTGLDQSISVRKGDGLEVLAPGEATCVTIAGMGGTLIASILENGKEKLRSVERLILQPNVGAINVRLWLMENKWELINEEILEEDGKIYEIIIAEKGESLQPYQKEKEAGLLFGPFLMKQKNEVFRKKWSMEQEHWRKILQQIEESGQGDSVLEKRKELAARIAMAEEALKD
ncbi:tRNA (adenine(22)-N(1))-methyltransferase TrmK [Bacillus sp. M6-12]|uniref:tRNA (adenine(22)-N(1))-methyltransferase n=1 Tax=Bacillus sp. M6-12 TaxID=2054166 RepID=UPI000C75BEA3|nr:tRNA (adenine(22)-N(1))-methyltransferase TrmK [Bacillus sp. M6-12]PLS15207.1 tRNA (adenine(22)-N(1))-methyltransferase TrmK [Bacillus sp. M6-12]